MSQENLVPNPSFEELDSCEQIGGFTTYGIANWSNSGLGTSDMYNACSEDGLGVPSNSQGWQNAKSGIGYAGLTVYDDLYIEGDTGWFVDIREYIQVELLDFLRKDSWYTISFYVSAADDYSTCFTSGIGGFVSSNPLNSDIPFELYNYPAQVASNEIIYDSISWVKISNSFRAIGDEKYLTIGCFEEDTDLEIDCISDTVEFRHSYYYIDDVSVLLDSTSYNVQVPNVVTPNGDGVNDYFQIYSSGYRGLTLRIFNRWGMKILESEGLDSRWNVEDSEEGIYFYTIDLERIDSSKVFKKGFVQLME